MTKLEELYAGFDAAADAAEATAARDAAWYAYENEHAKQKET